MSSVEGPNIVKEGLVLLLDAGNARSFFGEPTTNILPSAEHNGRLQLQILGQHIIQINIIVVNSFL